MFLSEDVEKPTYLIGIGIINSGDMSHYFDVKKATYLTVVLNSDWRAGPTRQDVRLSGCQIVILSDCQTVRLSDCETGL